MKKIIFVLFLQLATLALHSQEIAENTVGLRLGDNDGLGAEISYQRALSKHNRLEIDLGWRDARDYNAYKLVGLYQWVWNLDKGFNWYAGGGVGLGGYSIDDDVLLGDNDKTGSFYLLAGNVGIEYIFDFPVQISLDLRPEIYFGDEFREDDFGPDLAFSVRYRF